MYRFILYTAGYVWPLSVYYWKSTFIFHSNVEDKIYILERATNLKVKEVGA